MFSLSRTNSLSHTPTLSRSNTTGSSSSAKPSLLRRPSLQPRRSSHTSKDPELEALERAHYSAISNFTEDSLPAANAAFLLGARQLHLRSYTAALKSLTEAFAGHEKHSGADKLPTLKTAHCIAKAYAGKREWDSALEWYQKALDGKEKALGGRHTEVLEIIGEMAGVYRRKEEWDKALQNYQKALEGLKGTLERRDPGLLETVRGAAWCASKLEKWEVAQEYYDWAFKEEQTFPADPTTLENWKKIAAWLKESKKEREALKYAQQALRGYEKTLGKGRQETVEMLRTVGTLHSALKEWDETVESYRKALKGYEKLEGLDGVNTVNVAHNLAKVYEGKKNYGAALGMYAKAAAGYHKKESTQKDAVEIVGIMCKIFPKQREYTRADFDRLLRVLGKLPEEILEGLKTIAATMEEKKDYDEALQWYGRIFTAVESDKGKEDAATQDLFSTLAKLYPSVKSKEAGEVFMSALRLYETETPVAVPQALHEIVKAFKEGKDTTSNTSTKSKTSAALSKAGNAALKAGSPFKRERKALEWYSRTVSFYKKVSGEDHKVVIREIYSDMAAMYQKMDEHEPALECLGRALDRFEDSPEKGSEEHMAVISTLTTSAERFKENHEYDRCVKWYTRALSAAMAANDKEHASVHEIVCKMIELFPLSSKKQPGKYEHILETALEEFKDAYPAPVLAALHELATRFFDQQKHGDALTWFTRILKAYEDGPEKGSEKHIETIDYLTSKAKKFAKLGERDRAVKWHTAALNAAGKVDPKDKRVLEITFALAKAHFGLGAWDKSLDLLKSILGNEEVSAADSTEIRKDCAKFLTEKAAEFRGSAMRVSRDKILEWYTAGLEGYQKLDMKTEVAATQFAMAITYREKKDSDKALELVEKTLEECKSGEAGETYESALKSMYGIATGYKMSQHEKSLPLLYRVLNCCEENPPKSKRLYMDTLDTLCGIGNYLTKSERDRALEIFQGLLARCEKAGDSAKSIRMKALEGLARLAGLYRVDGKSDKAMELYNQVLEGSEKKASVHKAAIKSLYAAGASFRANKEYEKAHLWLSRALQAFENAYSESHVDTLRTHVKIASTYRDQGDQDKAKEHYEKALDGLTAHHPSHPDVPKSHSYLAGIYLSQSNQQKALEHYLSALPGFEAMGPTHTETLKTIQHIANIYLEQDELDKAFEHFRRAKQGWKLKDGDKKTKEYTAAINGLSAVLDKMQSKAAALAEAGDSDAALDAYKKAQSGYHKAFGKSSAEYKAVAAAAAALRESLDAANTPPNHPPSDPDLPASPAPSSPRHSTDSKRPERKRSPTSHKHSSRHHHHHHHHRHDTPPAADYLTLERLALEQTRQHLYAAAVRTYMELLPLKSSAVGQTSSSYLKTLAALAALQKKVGHFREAFELYATVFSCYGKKGDSRRAARTLRRLVSLLPRAPRCSDVLRGCVKTAARKKLLDERMLRALFSMAAKLERAGMRELALEWYKLVLKEREVVPDERCYAAKVAVGRMWVALGQAVKAKRYFREAAEGYESLGMEAEVVECEELLAGVAGKKKARARRGSVVSAAGKRRKAGGSTVGGQRRRRVKGGSAVGVARRGRKAGSAVGGRAVKTRARSRVRSKWGVDLA